VPYETFAALARAMPHVKYFESRHRGYVRLDIAPSQLSAAFQVVSDVRDPRATLSTLTRFVVENGRPGAQPG
jgi:alkaline phosphatase D